jgi:hypothetical protein
LFEYGTIPVLHRLLHGGELLLHRADWGEEDGSSALHWTCRSKIAPMSVGSAASSSRRCDTCHALVMAEKLTDEKNLVANHDDLFI